LTTILNKEEFSLEVIKFSKTYNLSYLESLQYHVDKYEIDLVVVKKVIDSYLNALLLEEAQKMNIIKKEQHDYI
jgi:hypothetical protein